MTFIIEQERNKVCFVNPEGMIFSPPASRLLGRHVVMWSTFCSVCRFFGLRLQASEGFPEEWVILRLFWSHQWLTGNGQPIFKDQERKNIYTGKMNSIITGWNVGRRSSEMVLDGKLSIRFDEDPEKRPCFPYDGGQRVLSENDDLRMAWILSPKQSVSILSRPRQ